MREVFAELKRVRRVAAELAEALRLAMPHLEAAAREDETAYSVARVALEKAEEAKL